MAVKWNKGAGNENDTKICELIYGLILLHGIVYCLETKKVFHHEL